MKDLFSKDLTESGGQDDTPIPLIDKVRLHIGLVLTLRNLLRFLTVWGFVLGVVVLVLRVIMLVSTQILLWTTVSVALGVIWAVFVSWRATPKRPAIQAFLDRCNKCGGLLMTAAEVPLGAWREKLPSLNYPALKWQGGKTLGLFALSAGFVIASFLVPQKYMVITSARPLDIVPEVEKLAEQVEAMQEAKIISEEQAQNIEEQLKQLTRQTNANDPAKTLEALDHLEETLSKEAAQDAIVALSEMQELANAEMMADGLSKDGNALSIELSAQAMAQLASMLESLSKDNEALENGLSQDVLNACKAGNLSFEQLKEIQKALKEGKFEITKDMAGLCKAGLIDPNNLKICLSPNAGDSQGLVAFLKANAGSMGMKDAFNAYCSNPGSGGVSRGRGDAPMTWGDESSKEGAKFKEQVLPPASMQALRESMKMGVSTAAPTVEQSGETSTGGALESAAAGSGEAVTEKILPRHRGVVKRYFEREEPNKTKN
jgi:hypothetical protein